MKPAFDLLDIAFGIAIVIVLTVLDLATHGAWILTCVGIPLVVLASHLKSKMRARK